VKVRLVWVALALSTLLLVWAYISSRKQFFPIDFYLSPKVSDLELDGRRINTTPVFDSGGQPQAFIVERIAVGSHVMSWRVGDRVLKASIQVKEGDPRLASPLAVEPPGSISIRSRDPWIMCEGVVELSILEPGGSP
jgi:hypothetical protein